MPDTPSKPPENRRKAILNRILTYEHDVLTTREIATVIDDVGKRQVKRNLVWMDKQQIIKGRQINKADTWLWWIPPDAIPAEDAVATARQIEDLFSNLYQTRWEFRVIGFGTALLMALLSLSFWAIIVIVFNINLASPTSMLFAVTAGYIFALLLILFGLFIFPVETLGNWPLVTESESEDKTN